MKGKGLPVYFVQPTQMHKECSLATLDCYGFFFSLERPSKPSRNFIFALERPSKPTGNFFSRWNDPQANGKFYFSCPTTPPYLNYLRNFVSTCAGRVWRTFRFEQ